MKLIHHDDESDVILKVIILHLLFSRPLAYSTLADLVHHVRQNLPLTDLSLAVQLFAKNIDDESLPSNIQTMSCKLLLNLVDCIRSKSEQENGNGRDILMRMLEVRSIDKRDALSTLMEISWFNFAFFFSLLGICAQVSHHCTIPAYFHFQEVQTSVRDGGSWSRSITRCTRYTYAIHHSCHSTSCTSYPCSNSNSTASNALWPVWREGRQTDFPSVRLSKLSQNSGLRGEDNYLGHHLL